MTAIFCRTGHKVCRAKEEEKEGEGGEEKDVAEEEGDSCSQRSSNRPMAASVDLEIHGNL